MWGNEMIPYLRDSRITVQLPVFLFDPGEPNFWGYQPVSFFALTPTILCARCSCACLVLREMVERFTTPTSRCSWVRFVGQPLGARGAALLAQGARQQLLLHDVWKRGGSVRELHRDWQHISTVPIAPSGFSSSTASATGPSKGVDGFRFDEASIFSG